VRALWVKFPDLAKECSSMLFFDTFLDRMNTLAFHLQNYYKPEPIIAGHEADEFDNHRYSSLQPYTLIYLHRCNLEQVNGNFIHILFFQHDY
jgi:hypothetical protein